MVTRRFVREISRPRTYHAGAFTIKMVFRLTPERCAPARGRLLARTFFTSGGRKVYIRELTRGYTKAARRFADFLRVVSRGFADKSLRRRAF